MENWLSIKEVEEQTDIPHQTIRRYLDRHGYHLKLKKKHKSILVHKTSIETIQKIRSWYSDNKNAEQVDELLVNNGIPMTIEYNDTHENVSINFPEVLSSLRKSMSEQQEFNENLLRYLNEKDEQIRKQGELIKHQQKLLEENLAKRDEQLLTVIREIQETKQQIAASTNKRWWQFWK